MCVSVWDHFLKFFCLKSTQGYDAHSHVRHQLVNARPPLQLSLRKFSVCIPCDWYGLGDVISPPKKVPQAVEVFCSQVCWGDTSPDCGLYQMEKIKSCGEVLALSYPVMILKVCNPVFSPGEYAFCEVNGCTVSPIMILIVCRFFSFFQMSARHSASPSQCKSLYQNLK